MKIIPCSHVGHVFRHRMPYSWGEDGYRTFIRNSLRVAEVWMDQYKEVYYDRIYYSQNEVSSYILIERTLFLMSMIHVFACLNY